jgi:ATP-dependent helicase HrpB
LWDEHEDAALSPRTRPEILEADLSSLALELADNGIADARELRWLDVPPDGALAAARELLRQLGATGADGRITKHGKQMAALPVSPRLSHMLLAGGAAGHGNLAAIVAALVEERDILGGARGEAPSDLRLRVELLTRNEGDGDAASLAGAHVLRDAVARVRDTARELRHRVFAGASNTDHRVTTADVHETGRLLALAYPERIAQRRDGAAPRFLLRNGSGAQLPAHDALASSPFLAIADLDGTAPEYRIMRAAVLTIEEVREDFGDQIETRDEVEWDDDARAVRAWRREQLGALVLSEHRLARPDAEQVRTTLVGMMRRIGVDAWPWPDRALQLRNRLAFVVRHDTAWPDVSSEALLESIEHWSVELLDGVSSWNQLSTADWNGMLLSLLTWPQRAELDGIVPTHIEVPTGSRVPVDYSDAGSPLLAVRLQEIFGWTDTPRLMNGRVPVTIQLLSPANRPVQVTRDLAGFWKTSYFDVRKEMRGRYPRHSWPDDPLTAQPTRRAKPRGT